MFEVFNVPFDDLSKNQLDAILRGWLLGDHKKMIFTPNAEFLLRAKDDEEFREVLQSAHLSLPDSVSLRFAAAANGDRSKFRHTGVDTLEHLAKICDDHGKRLMLFGGSDENARLAAQALRSRFPDLDVVGINPGVIDHQSGEVESDVLDLIENHAPDVLAVGLTFGKQERFILDYLKKLSKTKIAIGVGGSFEMIAGVLPRAPQMMRRSGFEWLWRLGIEPKRAGRIFDASVRFPVAVAYDTLKRGRFLRACTAVPPEVLRQLIGR